MARRILRKVRHWKQRFDPNVKFIFRRGMTFAGKKHQRGDYVPKKLLTNRLKLENFWEAEVIELAEFAVPGRPISLLGVEAVLALPMPEGVSLKHIGNHWYEITVPDGEPVRKQGKKGVDTFLKEYQEAQDTDGDES